MRAAIYKYSPEIVLCQEGVANYGSSSNSIASNRVIVKLIGTIVSYFITEKHSISSIIRLGTSLRITDLQLQGEIIIKCDHEINFLFCSADILERILHVYAHKEVKTKYFRAVRHKLHWL